MNDELNHKKRKRSIDALERDLYDPQQDFDQRTRRKIHGRDIDLEQDFRDEDFDALAKKRPKRKLPVSFFKKIFFVALMFFVVTAVIAFVSLYKGTQSVSDDLISMEILGQPFVDSGEVLELRVRVQNFNQKSLELPDLVLSYPKDSALEADPVFLRRSLENIGTGERVSEEFDITLFGQEGDIRELTATLEYRIEGSSSIFIKEFEHEVIIRSTPTQVSITAPKEIVRNQQLDLLVDISSNSTNQINDTLLKVNYPRGFEFISADPAPDFEDNIWYFDNVTNEKDRIVLSGRLAALEGQGQSFNVEFGKQNQNQKNQIETIFNALVHTIDVQKSFITADLRVDRQVPDGEVIIRGGDNVDVEITFENTLDEILKDVILEVTLDGGLYDPSTDSFIRVLDGFFNSNIDTITWDKTTLDALEFLEPGERGTVSFTVETPKLVSQTGALENPELNIAVNVSGIEINGKTRNAESVARAEIVANSDIQLIGKVTHYDGPFKNYGPMPPRINTATSYTVTLQAINSSNDLEDATIKTFLPSYVTWLNSIAPSVERNNVSYNTTTREVTWNLGSLESGVGIGTKNPRQLSFQIEVLPSLSQVGEKVDVTDDIIFSGTDSFTGAELSFRKTSLSNRLENDSSEVGADGKITQ